MPQNLIDIGIDIPKLEAQKEEAIAIVKELHTQLSQMSEKVVSPINIQGLTQLNSAVSKTNTQFSELEKTLTNVISLMSTYNSVNNQGNGKTSAAKAKTEEERAWIQMMKEANSVANQVAKQQIALEKQEAAEIVKGEKLKREAKKETDQLNKKINAEQTRIIEKSIADQKRANSQIIADQKRKEKSDQQEIKDLELLNNAYKQLILRQKELSSSYANIILQGGQNSPFGKRIRSELNEVSGTINKVDKELEKAGSTGILSLSRGLTEVFSQIRTIAYILPGLGIAGIFNVAFEAIEKCAEATGLFNDKIKDSIELEKQLASLTREVNNILNERINSFEKYSNDNVRYYERLKNLSESTGTNYENQFKDIDNFNKARKEAADERVNDLNASYTKAAELNTKIQILADRRQKIAEKLQTINSDIFNKQNEKISLDNLNLNINDLSKVPQELIEKTISKAGKISGLKDLREVLTSQLEALDKEAENTKNTFEDVTNALKDQENANTEIQIESNKRKKFLDDEERKKYIENIKIKAEKEKAFNEDILNDSLSTEKQKIEAVKNIQKANKNISQADYEDVAKDISKSKVDKDLASYNLSKEILNINISANKDIENIQKDFLEKRLQAIENATQDEIILDQLKNEKLFKSENSSYFERFNALSKYIDDRKNSIKEYYNFEKDRIIRTVPEDLQPQRMAELGKSVDKQIFETTQNVRENVFSIVDSYYKSQIKLIESSYNDQLSLTREKEITELKELNDSYEAKNISYRKYALKKKEIQQKYLVEGDKEQIAKDQEELSKLLGLQDELNKKADLARENYINAGTEDEAEKYGSELEALNKERSDLLDKIQDKDAKTQKDRLKLEEDTNKAILEARNKLTANLIRLEKQLFDLVKHIVDENYQAKIEKVDEENQAYQDSADKQIDAIERSTLAEKDKNAYEIQLQAQKTEADRKATQEQKKLRHDQAVFDRSIDIAQIILNTQLAITGALAQAKTLGGLAIGLAISYGALGATALATALTTKIPSYAKGGKHMKDGFALFAEAGPEWKKEPNKKPVLYTQPTVEWLKSGTELIPTYSEPNISERKYVDNTWEQTKFLAKAINGLNYNKKKNIVSAVVNVNFKSIEYKNRIING